MMQQTIYDRLDELADEALSYEDNNTAIILQALLGAKKSGHDGLLAAHIQDFIRTVLIPSIR